MAPERQLWRTEANQDDEDVQPAETFVSRQQRVGADEWRSEKTPGDDRLYSQCSHKSHTHQAEP